MSIEIRLHWQLDATGGEDQSRLRKGHADACLVSHAARPFSPLKSNKSQKPGVKNKRLNLAWDDDYLAKFHSGK